MLKFAEIRAALSPLSGLAGRAAAGHQGLTPLANHLCPVGAEKQCPLPSGRGVPSAIPGDILPA